MKCWLLVMMGLPLLAAAEEGWDGSFEVRGVSTSGNSRMDRWQGALSLQDRFGANLLELDASSLFERSAAAGEARHLTRQVQEVSLEYARFHEDWPGWYAFLQPRWRYVGPAAEHLAFMALGLGWFSEPAEDEQGSWRMESGVGYRRHLLAGQEPQVSGMALVSIEAEQPVSSALTFSGRFRGERGSHDYLLSLQLRLKHRLNDRLSFSLGWDGRRSGPVAEAMRHTDTATLLGAEYAF